MSKLIKKASKIELKEVRKKRSNNQNSYLHAIIAIMAIEYGYTILEMKIVYKREYGLIYDNNGNKFIRSTADLNTVEMAEFIEFIRNKAAKESVYIPSPEEYYSDSTSIDSYIENNRRYL